MRVAVVSDDTMPRPTNGPTDNSTDESTDNSTDSSTDSSPDSSTADTGDSTTVDPTQIAREPPAGWPEPTRPADDRIDVVLLGTYHMDQPGLDEVDPDVPDPMAATQQRQLRELADRLTALQPVSPRPVL